MEFVDLVHNCGIGSSGFGAAVVKMMRKGYVKFRFRE